jgi:hypothetical protein
VAVLKEFACKAHGPFEEIVEQDTTPPCPKGCSPRFVVREIRSAPAARGVITGKMDTLYRNVAKDFGLSNLKVDKENGKSVMQNLQSGENFSPRWVDVPREAAKGGFASSMGLTSGNAIAGANFVKPTPIFDGSYKAPFPSVE